MKHAKSRKDRAEEVNSSRAAATDRSSPVESEELLTAQEVAGMLRLSISSVYRLIAAGAFPRIRIGGAARFSRRDIAGYIARAGQRTLAEDQHGADVGSEASELIESAGDERSGDINGE